MSKTLGRPAVGRRGNDRGCNELYAITDSEQHRSSYAPIKMDGEIMTCMKRISDWDSERQTSKLQREVMREYSVKGEYYSQGSMGERSGG